MKGEKVGFQSEDCISGSVDFHPSDVSNCLGFASAFSDLPRPKSNFFALDAVLFCTEGIAQKFCCFDSC